MTKSASGESRPELGFVSLEYVLASTFALLLVVVLCNGLVNLYIRAAVRDALDDGVRSAVPATGSSEQCEARTAEALQSLVRGAYTDSVRVRCSVAAGVVRADAKVRLVGFIPWMIPTWTFDVHAVARQDIE